MDSEQIAKSLKVQKESFDAALKKMISSGSVRASEIKTAEKKPAKIIEPSH